MKSQPGWRCQTRPATARATIQSTIRTSNSPTKSECAARGGNFGSLSISTSRFLIAGSARWDLISILFPGTLFGKTWYLDSHSGIFPRQGNGPETRGPDGEVEPAPLAMGRSLTVAPEVDAQRLAIESLTGELQLLDERNRHNNGWFVVRTIVPAGKSAGAVEWIVTPNAIPGWKSLPVAKD